LKRAFSEPLKIEVKPIIIDEKKDIWDYEKVHLTIWFVDGTKWEEHSSWFDLDYLINVFYKKYFERNIDETFFNILEEIRQDFVEPLETRYKKKEYAKRIYQEQKDMVDMARQEREQREKLERIKLEDKKLSEKIQRLSCAFEKREETQLNEYKQYKIFLDTPPSEINFRPMVDF
jgi:hypothetical protein